MTFLKRQLSSLSTHCIIHREALVCKAVSQGISEVLDSAVECVNFIKANALNRRLFRDMCENSDED